MHVHGQQNSFNSTTDAREVDTNPGGRHHTLSVLPISPMSGKTFRLPADKYTGISLALTLIIFLNDQTGSSFRNSHSFTECAGLSWKYRRRLFESLFLTYSRTVTKVNQNEALLRKVAFLEMEKPPVGAGTFCPSHMLAFCIPHCRKYLPTWRTVKYSMGEGQDVPAPTKGFSFPKTAIFQRRSSLFDFVSR
jgi:hypothetical protein